MENQRWGSGWFLSLSPVPRSYLGIPSMTCSDTVVLRKLDFLENYSYAAPWSGGAMTVLAFQWAMTDVAGFMIWYLSRLGHIRYVYFVYPNHIEELYIYVSWLSWEIIIVIITWAVVAKPWLVISSGLVLPIISGIIIPDQCNGMTVDN